MDFNIFYSWQSDSPSDLNRTFIEQALRDAVKSICTENTLDDLPFVDLGMQRVPGSPEIATIMFRKIGRSAIFVADATLVGEIKEEPGKKAANPTLVGEIKGGTVKKTANPNVMVEMGYAAAFLGWERIICVMNEYFGKAEEQPIDVRNRRFPIDYTLASTKENEAKTKKKLTEELKKAIQTIFDYELESANEAIALLDVNCLNLMQLHAASGFFRHPIRMQQS